MMASSQGLEQAVDEHLSLGALEGHYDFGLSGLVDAGADPIQQFVGSYDWTVVPVSGGLNVTLTNSTSVKSALYHLAPVSWNHARPYSGWMWYSPMGTTYQTYEVFVPWR